MSEPKKHHYVPQVYLRNFSFGKEKNPKLHVLATSSGRIYPANVCDSAAERDFYTVDSLVDKYMWEKHYASTIEPILGDLIKKLRSRCENVLIQNNALVLTQEEKFQLALSMLFQLSRGKKPVTILKNCMTGYSQGYVSRLEQSLDR